MLHMRASSASKAGARISGRECADAVAPELLRNDGAAHRFGEVARFARMRRGVEHRLEHASGSRGHARSRSSSPNARCAVDDRQEVGADVLDDRRHGRAQMFEQRLELLAAEELGRVRPHDLREMRADDRDRIEDVSAPAACARSRSSGAIDFAARP